MEWYIRKMEPQDENAYLQFLGGLIKARPVSIHYQWLYRGNPHGEALTWLAIDRKEENIIGCTSVFPKKVWVKDKVILGCVGGDTFVDPNYQRRGIATKMHQVSCVGAAEAGIRFQYGFPNVENTGAHLKAGSHFPGDFQVIKCFLRIEPIVRKLNLGKTLSTGMSKLGNKILSLYVRSKLSGITDRDEKLERISSFDNRFDRLMETALPSFNICVVRDSQYLGWRYFKNHQENRIILGYEHEGTVHGFAVLEFEKNTCCLFDFFVRKEDGLIEDFIDALLKFLISRGYESVWLGVNASGNYIKNFSHFGFKLIHFEKNPLEVLLPDDDKDIDYLTDLKNWYLTLGDTDAA